jgi:hypothetical protein
MKKIIISIAAFWMIMSVSSCGGGQKKEVVMPRPLNISVYLDLSDRLIRDLTPNQTYRDTAIINYLVDYFRSQTLGPTILKSENKMKVFFYPTPKDTEISTLAQGLSVDIASKQGVEKRKALDEMKGIFQNNLAHIYEETLNAKTWVGCDIWDFFSNKKVDNLCVKNGARNIIVILTDGYIFAEDNKIKEDNNAFSYILPQTLNIEGSSLIDRRHGKLKDKGIEVLMLEVNPYQPNQRDKMIKVLEDWFSAMGIEKFVVAETDANLTNTQTIIKNFLEN